MTKQETGQILAIIVEVYPMFRKERNPELTARIWHALFQDVTYQQAKQALMEFIATDTKGFPPTPGALRARIFSRAEPEELSEVDAWNLTLRAVKRGIYYAKQEFDKLPPAVRRVVGSSENIYQWASMDDWQIQNSVAPWFFRAYQQQKEKERDERMLPSGNLLLPTEDS